MIGVPKTRYWIAQALILVWWLLDWAILGTPANAAPDSNGFVVSVVHSLIVLFAPFTLLIAVVVGMLDGLAGEDDKSVAAALVGGLALLVAFLGLGLPELLQPSKTPVDLRMAMLVALESVVLLEWGVAALVRLGRRIRTST